MKILTLCVFAAALAACGPSFQHQTPKGFVELDEESQYDYRAVSADGMVLAVRALDHEPKGEMSFWTEAIENHMRRRAGYALLDTRDVKASGGLAGKQLRFGHDRGKDPHLYFITVFVTDKKIYVLEAGGTKEQMTAREADLMASISTFQPK